MLSNAIVNHTRFGLRAAHRTTSCRTIHLIKLSPESLSAISQSSPLPSQKSLSKRVSSTLSNTRSKKRPNEIKQIHNMSLIESIPAMVSTGMFPQQVAAVSAIQRPTNEQLRSLFVASAIPMIGFGFMDNFIMIAAGGYIDATLGVKFGIATMTAAAMGQVVSDVSGVLCGGALERSLQKLGLMSPPQLTSAQRALPLVRNTSLAGGAIGVATGCILGCVALYFVDEKEDISSQTLAIRQNCEEDWRALWDLISEMEGDDVSSNHYDIHVVDKDLARWLGTIDLGDNRGKVNVTLLQNKDSTLTQCMKRKECIVDSRHGEQARYYVPVVSKRSNDQVSAVVELTGNGELSCHDEKLMKLLASHIGLLFHRYQ